MFYYNQESFDFNGDDAIKRVSTIRFESVSPDRPKSYNYWL